MKKNLFISVFIFATVLNSFSQGKKYSTKNFLVEKAAIVLPLDLKDDWMPQLQNLEMPHPGSERGHLLKVKEESRKKFPVKNAGTKIFRIPDEAPVPLILRGFEANPQGSSVPLDNHLAVSNEGKLISVSNTVIRAYDLIADSMLFSKALGTFSQPLGISGSKFDPKAIYDYENDKFIVVFLNGNTPNTSKIILAFSTTNNPADAWNLYYLSGNPLTDTTWFDYPAIAITKDELFLTGNQIIPGQPWQTGFSQTLIWQIDKQAAFAGDSLLNAKLWKDIWFGNNPIRNMNPIGGGSKLYGSNIYFLSDRNFAIQNDTIFMVEITGTINDANAELKVKYGIADVSYGVPPTARQGSGHTFDTNDGRILGGFFENEKIQFTGNTIDTTTGLAAVYHGIIENYTDDIFSVKGKIIGDTTMDFGYPNISYSGKQECDDEAIITFNHTAPSVFAGFSAVYYSNDKKYSGAVKLKEGENYVNILSGVYERWGDYSGSQRKFDEPGKIWAVGSWGTAQKKNASWITLLQSPDSNSMSIQISDSKNASVYDGDDGYAVVTAAGGNEPYSYLWSNGGIQSAISGLKSAVYYVTVTDAYSCFFTDSVEIMQPEPPVPDTIKIPEAAFFPNPVADMASMNFVLETDELITISIHDAGGKLVKILLEDNAKSGRNIFTFSTAPLAQGIYFLRITAGKRKILAEKFVKGNG